jgi:cytochrome subunit of sulfide dehydrogenase
MKNLLTLAACAAATLYSPWSLAQDAHLARNLAATCANCHGTDGKAKGAMVALAGYPADRLVATMADFKTGKRPATIMHQISRGYSDAQVTLIAGYFAQQKP